MDNSQRPIFILVDRLMTLMIYDLHGRGYDL